MSMIDEPIVGLDGTVRLSPVLRDNRPPISSHHPIGEEDFTLLGKLGKGGFSHVYLGRLKMTGS